MSAELVGDAVRLAGDEGALRYAQLFAIDASGAALPARFAVEASRLALVVDTREAEWPVAIDPLIYTEEQILTPPPNELGRDGSMLERFGASVAIEGDLALVGAPFDAGGGSAYVLVRSGGVWSFEAKLVADDRGVDDLFGSSVSLSGDTALIGAADDDDAGSDSGSAYVFVRSGTTWTQQAKLTASDGAADDQLGNCVSLSGDTALVGAHRDDAAAGSHSGSAYVFVRSGTTWTQQAKLTASDGAADDRFGTSVSVSGDTALVGADGVDDLALDMGAAYVFVRSGTTWTEQQKLMATDRAIGDAFGNSVSLSGDTALIGAFRDATGLGRGSAYVFVRSGTTWAEQAKLTPSDGGNNEFGYSVSLSGDTALIGARADSWLGHLRSGSAYVFVRSGTTWTEEAELRASDLAESDELGSSVALSGGTALVGAPRADDITNPDSGAAYVFVRSAGLWAQQQKLAVVAGARDSGFGSSVSVSGDTALIGSPRDDDRRPNGGAVYVFVRSGTAWAQQAKLTVFEPTLHEYLRFGQSVSLSGDTALIGTLVDSDLISQSSAYVFVRSGTTWTEQQKLTAGDGFIGDRFGSSVSVSGDTALVGAPHDDDLGSRSGSAYVFVRSGTTWTEQQKLTASLGVAGDELGVSVSLSGDTALIGATGVHDVSPEIGAAYVFTRIGATWTERETLTASDAAPQDRLGSAVAISGDITVLGVPLRDFPPPYGDGDEGAAYVGALTRQPDGSGCAGDAECTSGFCVDGVCCDTACGGDATHDCQVCAVAAGATTDGVCVGTTGNACAGTVCTTPGVCDSGACVGSTSLCDALTTCSESSGTYACTACPAGTASADGTGASACTPCADGTWSAVGATSCAPWTDCVPGERVASAGTSTADQTCAACDAGEYSSTTNAASCAAWTTCPAGTYVSAPGSASSDRVCSACDDGTYSSTPNAIACAAWTHCSAGGYVMSPGTASSDRTCAACADGTYSSVMDAASCTAWTECAASGEYESAAPSATSDRVCAACTVCGEGEVEVSACTADADTVCAPAGDAGSPDAGADAGRLDGGAAGVDGGADAGIGASSAGCACNAGAPSAPSPALGFLLVLGWVVGRRRRAPQPKPTDRDPLP